jgi:Tol biopolymer transport system component
MRAKGRMRCRRAIAALVACLPMSAAPARGAASSTILVSRPSGLGPLPAPGNGFAFAVGAFVSGDGTKIVFASGADDLGVVDDLRHVWVRDTVAGTTSLVDRAPGDRPGNGTQVFGAAISRDGSRVCFVSDASNLVSGVSGIHAFVVDLSSGETFVADRAPGATGEPGNSSAGRCALDANGSRVVFESAANNLVSGDTNNATDVFVRDLDAATTVRVSTTAAGTQAPKGGSDGVINDDGTRIAFVSMDPLVAGDTNMQLDVFVRDTLANTLVRASVGSGPTQAIGSSREPSIDGSGGHVAFSSTANNLDLGGDGNQKVDVFWRDLTGSDTTILMSRATGSGGTLGDGDSFRPAISGDGLGVAFETLATNLGGNPLPDRLQVYHRRLGTNETVLLSRASGAAGAPGNGFSFNVAIGTSPTITAWSSSSLNLDPDASGDFQQVYARQLSGPQTTAVVSRPSGDAPRASLIDTSFIGNMHAMSDDGRLVVFTSSADGLDPEGAAPFPHVYVRDTLTQDLRLVDRAAGPAGVVADGGPIGTAAISSDGTHVLFMSSATNLVPGVTAPQVYVRDLVTGAIDVASRADGMAGALVDDTGVDRADVSTGGTHVVFTTAGALSAVDTNATLDIYVRNRAGGTTTLVSVAADGTAADSFSFSPTISDDGTRVAFTSQATNLLEGVTTSGFHVFVRDLVAGTTALADRQANGEPGTSSAGSPVLSGTGDRVAFSADAALTVEPVPEFPAIYVRDLVAGVTLLASRDDGPSGAALSAASGVSGLSRDGLRVTFAEPAFVTPPEIQRILVRDLAAGTTVLVSAADGGMDPGNASSFGSSPNGDGSCIAFDSRADNLTTPSYGTRDFSQVYVRAVTDACLATNTPPTTTTTLPPGAGGTPIPATLVMVRPGRVAKMVANGMAPLAAGIDPRASGGTLSIRGATGAATYALPASGWKPVGRRRPKGFKFSGSPCTVSFVKRRITAVCKGDTGTLALPEAGPVGVTLDLGAGAAFCAECGGTPAGKASRVFKRKRCPAPPACG